MGTRKTKTIKFDVLDKGVRINYQTVIEEVIGIKIAELSCYKYDEDDLDGTAIFEPDCDYEIIIRPKK